MSWLRIDHGDARRFPLSHDLLLDLCVGDILGFFFEKCRRKIYDVSDDILTVFNQFFFSVSTGFSMYSHSKLFFFLLDALLTMESI